MSFRRNPASRWQREIPGARWYAADLHLHTIDDLPGGRAALPARMPADARSPSGQAHYAREFLRALVRNEVHVAGLTPHSPYAIDHPEVSAVWAIVDEWNDGVDDDGIPFREKVYAIFPGFEPSFRDGSRGLHLLFLFDPECGRDRFRKAFDLLMGGVHPWQDGRLLISDKEARQALNELKTFQRREDSSSSMEGVSWNYMVLAPHIDANNGLLGSMKSQVLELFDHDGISGLELGDDKTPDDTLKNRPWLLDGMKGHLQSFFHASDSYRLDDIGRRFTWIKLATPRIESLRQAFIASDSRLRLAFGGEEDELQRPVSPSQTPASNGRPWLREVAISGGSSFFGNGDNGEASGARFRLSPDLTCIIGGSMTGKSTFLDGLRVYTGARLPDDDSLCRQVQARGRDVFALGRPNIVLDCPGSDPVAPDQERWPAQFFAQNELQRLSTDDNAVEQILARLIPIETDGIERRRDVLLDLDSSLSSAAKTLDRCDQRVAEAEQAYGRSAEARRTIDTFSQAGVALLHQAARDRQSWMAVRDAASGIRDSLKNDAILPAKSQEIPSSLTPAIRHSDVDIEPLHLRGRWKSIIDRIETVVDDLNKWLSDVDSLLNAISSRETTLRSDMERALGERGLSADKLLEFRALSRQSALLSQYKAVLEEARQEQHWHDCVFRQELEERRAVISDQRRAFERVADGIRITFSDRIRVRRLDHGDTRILEQFLGEFRQRGITRWWNGLSAEQRPSPDFLAHCLDADTLDAVGMSRTVQDSFRECMTRSKRRRLAALRCPDRYILELRMDDGSFRLLDSLSGGQRVSVLLSLLLESSDDRPLVIDQPEDELDNRFLFDTVLPALKTLRGKRQVIVATHSANLVVNGDADLVIELQANAKHGRISCAGGIEDPAVRNAIVRTLDGGKEAFRLRRRKYGF